MNRNIQDIIRYFNLSECPMECDLSTELGQLQLDSRSVSNGDVFIAVKGHQVDGRLFINDAIQAGVGCLLSEAESDDLAISTELHTYGEQVVLEVRVPHLSQCLSQFAEAYYGSPSSSLPIVGITGTNGKTTISQLVAQWSELLGKKSASVGTLGAGLYGQLHTTNNTTPSAIEISQNLATFKQEKVKLVTMEVSSHGLALNRVRGIHFDTAVFTNLTRDHLDFHKTLENYKNAKWGLFSEHRDELMVASVNRRVLNVDDELGADWAKELSDPFAVSIEPSKLTELELNFKQYLCATNIVFHNYGVDIEFKSSFGMGMIKSALLGTFNVSNLMLALATMLAQGYPLNELIDTASQLSPVAGRMDRIVKSGYPTAVVDYAHTPDALEKAIKAVSEHNQGEIWVVFGCGGDRDAGKRPLMGAVADRYADHIVVTNDNPRTENEANIINDILPGIKTKQPQIIPDRKDAITYAIQSAKENDIVLVAGKGHEDYQIIGKDKIHFSDQETIKTLLGMQDA